MKYMGRYPQASIGSDRHLCHAFPFGGLRWSEFANTCRILRHRGIHHHVAFGYLQLSVFACSAHCHGLERRAGVTCLDKPHQLDTNAKLRYVQCESETIKKEMP